MPTEDGLYYSIDCVYPIKDVANSYTVLEVRHPQYSSILQGFVLLQVIIFIIDIFW